MNEPGMVDLMNLVLDGVATPAQRSELEGYLSNHPEGRAHYDELARLTHRLDVEPMADSPAELEPRILEAIHGLGHPRALAPSATGFSPWLKAFLAPPKLRPWSMFGMGLATGVFLFAAVQFGRSGAWDIARDIDPSNVSGSMVPSAGRTPVGALSIDTASGAVGGSAVVFQDGKSVGVDITLQSTVGVEWLLEFDSSVLTLERLERKGGATTAFAANPGSIRGLHTGEGGMKVVFSGPVDAAQAVVLKVFKSGEMVFEGTPSPTR